MEELCKFTVLSNRTDNFDDPLLLRCAPRRPSIEQALDAQGAVRIRDGTASVVAVTIFGGAAYTDMFSSFCAMCAAAGVYHLLGLALDKAAFQSTASGALVGVRGRADPPSSMVPRCSSVFSAGLAEYIRTTPDAGPSSRYHKEYGALSPWYSIGRVQLLYLAQVVHANVSALMVEMDVLLLRPLLTAIEREAASHPRSNLSRFDFAALSCIKTPHHNRINLGLMLWQASSAAVNLDFLGTVAWKSIRDKSWNQQTFNLELGCRMAHKCIGPAPSLLRLEFCEMSAGTRREWAEQSALPGVIEQVHRLGDVRRAVALTRHVAIHNVGGAADKVPALYAGLMVDAYPARLPAEHGAEGSAGTDVEGAEALVQSPSVSGKSPSSSASTVPLTTTASPPRAGYVLVLTPNLSDWIVDQTAAALMRELYTLSLALGEVLRRTPLLVLQPPIIAANSTVHHVMPQCYDMRQLQTCEGSFLSAAFLHGHLFLNRSAVPRWAAAKWHRESEKMSSVLRSERERQPSKPPVGSPMGWPAPPPLNASAHAASARAAPSREMAGDALRSDAGDDTTLLVFDLAPPRAQSRTSSSASSGTSRATSTSAPLPTLEQALTPTEPPSRRWALSLLHAMSRMSADWPAAASAANHCVSRLFSTHPSVYTRRDGLMYGCPRAFIGAPSRDQLHEHLLLDGLEDAPASG